MLTLSFGFKKPESGDTGSVVFPALEGNIQQLNDHDHDGSNSSKISSSSVTPLFVDLVAGSWVSESNGLYSQTVTLPGALSFDTTGYEAQLATDGHVVHPTIEKVSASQYKIYTNDNSQGMKVLYI